MRTVGRCAAVLLGILSGVLLSACAPGIGGDSLNRTQADQKSGLLPLPHKRVTLVPIRRELAERARLQNARARATTDRDGTIQTALDAAERGEYSRALNLLEILVRRNPRDGEVRFFLGSIYLREDEGLQAIKYLTDAIEFGYRKPSAYHQLGLAYLSLGKTSAATKVWRTAQRAKLSNAEIETALGLAALDEGELSRARSFFQKAIKLDPSFVDAYNGLGLVYLQEGSLEKAISAWKKAGRGSRAEGSTKFVISGSAGAGFGGSPLGVLVGPDYSSIENAITEARRLEEEENIAGALTLVKETLASDRKNPELLHYYGYLQALTENYRGARESLEQAAKFGAGGVEFAVNRALVLGQLGEEGRALEVLEEALKSSPQDVRLLSQQGVLFGLQGKIPEAESTFRAALRINEEYLPAMNDLGLLHLRMRRFNEARESFRKGIVLSGGDPRIRFNYALSLLLLDDAEEALRQFQMLQSTLPNDPDVPLNLGYLAGERGDYDEAKRHFKRALALDRNYDLALNNLGVAHQLLGENEQARLAYGRALSSNPLLGAAHNNLASLDLKEGRREEALISYQKAVKVDPSDFESRRNLGHLLVAAGKPQEAISHLQLAYAQNERDLDTLFDLAYAYQQTGKGEEAISFYEKFVRLAEDSSDRAEQVIQAERAIQRIRYP